MYDQRHGGKILDLGHTGRLLENGFLFYDKASGSGFCQPTGTCLIGPQRGQRLKALPSWILPWETWRRLHPSTRVMLPPPGESYDYERDVYKDYDLSSRIGLYRVQELDPRLAPKALVLGVDLDGIAQCWSANFLAHRQLVNGQVGETPVVVWWDREGQWGTCLDRRIQGKLLEFEPAGELRMADESGAVWDIIGRCQSGAMRGARLKAIPARVVYWFAWQAHYPNSQLHWRL